MTPKPFSPFSRPPATTRSRALRIRTDRVRHPHAPRAPTRTHARTHAQTKEYLPAPALRRILALQTELVKLTAAHAPPAAAAAAAIDRGSITNPSLISAARAPPAAAQRALLSANFGAGPRSGGGGGGGGNALGRNLLSAGDRLRDLIVPDALASLVTAPAGWIPGIGLGGGGGGGSTKRDASEKDAARAERIREELEEVLAAQCPMCEGVVAGLDKPFVQPGEVDASWDL